MSNPVASAELMRQQSRRIPLVELYDSLSVERRPSMEGGHRQVDPYLWYLVVDLTCGICSLPNIFI